MSFKTKDGQEYELLTYEAWSEAGTSIAAAINRSRPSAASPPSWAYIVKRSSDGALLRFVINYGFTFGTNINTDSIEYNLRLIKRALDSDEGETVIQEATRTQHVIDGTIELEDEEGSEDSGGFQSFVF